MMEAGKSYSGPEGRRLIISIEDDVVIYVLPISLDQGTCPLAEMAGWAEYVRPA